MLYLFNYLRVLIVVYFIKNLYIVVFFQPRIKPFI